MYYKLNWFASASKTQKDFNQYPKLLLISRGSCVHFSSIEPETVSYKN